MSEVTALQASALLRALSADPRIAGLAAPIGTIGVSAGVYYQKIGSDDSQWVQLGIDFVHVTVATSTITYAFAGNLAKGIRIRGHIINNAGQLLVCFLRPNALDGSDNKQRMRVLTLDSGGLTNTGDTMLRIATVATGLQSDFRCEFATTQRAFRGVLCHETTGHFGVEFTENLYSGMHEDATVEYTSLTLRAAKGDGSSLGETGFGVGSWFSFEQLGDPAL